MTIQWKLSLILAFCFSVKAAQFTTSSCPAGTFYETGTKYFEEESYDTPRLFGTGLLRQNYAGNPIIKLRNTCTDSEKDFYGTLSGALEDSTGNSVYDFTETAGCELRVVQWYDQFISGGKDLYQPDNDYQPSYLPTLGAVWFDTNNQSGFETFLHFGSTSNNMASATKHPFDDGYVNAAAYSYRVVFEDWAPSNTYGMLDFGDSINWDPAEAFKMRFQSDSSGTGGKQYESWHEEWATASEAEPVSAFPSVLTGVWNGTHWFNYVDNSAGSSNDFAPDTDPDFYNFMEDHHAYVGKIDDESNSAHIGISFIFFDRNDYPSSGSRSLSSVNQLGTGPCTPCSAGKTVSAGASGASAAAVCTSLCSTGTYNDGTGRGCVDCPMGRYASSTGATQCTDCGDGRYTSIQGATSSSSCFSCPQGTYALSSTYLETCDTCRDSSSCIVCPVGYYSSSSASSACTACPDGQTTSFTGETSSAACSDCDQGKYGTTGQPGCTDCGPGTWQGLYGHVGACTACPDGKYVPAGDGITEDACDFCFYENTYAPANSGYSTECVYCPAGYGTDFSIEQYGCQVVSDGYYRGATDEYLSECPIGTIGPWSTTGVIPTDETACISCAPGEASEGYASTYCTNCADLNLYTEDSFYCNYCGEGSESGDGTACTLCAAGSYSMGGQTECTLCPGGQLSAVGATGEDECVSPQSNFLTAMAVIVLVVPFSVEYLIHGRNHRVAFLRQERVTKNLVKYSRTVMASLYHYIARAHAERKRDLGMRIIKTFIFMFWALVIVLVLTLGAFVSTLSQVFFRSMIMWKGYNIGVNYDDIIRHGVDAMVFLLDLPFVLYLFYPAIYAFSFFASFSIELDAIDVSCEGSQAPLELFINVIILGITIIVIESDYQIFRAVTFSGVTNNFFEAITQPCYRAWAVRENGSKKYPTKRGWFKYLRIGIATIIAKGLGGFDFFQSFLQYCMSLVVWVPFMYGHPSTPQCDNVDGWEDSDTAIASVATLQAYMLLVPAIYEIAKVLVPGLPASFTPVDDVEFKRDPKPSWFHAIKFTSFLAPDLHFAVLSAGWINKIKHNTPHETGQNSKTLQEILEMDDLLEKEKEREDLLRAQKEGLLPSDTPAGAVLAQPVDDDTPPATKEAAAQFELTSLKTPSGAGKLRLDPVSTKMARDVETGKMFNVNEVDKTMLPGFRVIATGTNGVIPSAEQPGLYCARPGYNIKVWAHYPVVAASNKDVLDSVYVLVRIDRATGRIDLARPYDLVHNGSTGLCDGRGGDKLVHDMNQTDHNHLVVLYTVGDANAGRLETEGLLDAVKRCGGSQKIFGSKSKFEEGSVYMLLGVPTAGEGSGFERNQGGDKHANLDVAFEVTELGFALLDIHEDEVEDFCCISSRSYLLSTMWPRTEAENKEWKERQKANMPSYWTLCRLEMAELKENWIMKLITLPFLACCGGVPWIFRFLVVFLHIGHVLTYVGRKAIFITVWKYTKFLLICLGVWNTEGVDVMHIHEHALHASTVWDKPIRKKSAKAYAIYRKNMSRQAANMVKQQSMVDKIRGKKPLTYEEEVEKSRREAEEEGKVSPHKERTHIKTDKQLEAQLAKDDEEGDEGDIQKDYDWVEGDDGVKIKLRKESKEQRKLQQQELKRKLRSDYSAILDAVVACRSTILQIIPVLSLVSILACTTASTPLLVTDKRLRKNLPEVFISEPFAEARVQERETIEEAEVVRRHEMTEFDHDVPNPEYQLDPRGKPEPVPAERRLEIEEANEHNREEMRAVMTQPPRVVNEWMVFMNGISLMITESRGIGAMINYYKFALTVGILLTPPSMLKFWMYSAVLILVPYCIIASLQVNVMLGRAMDITDTDLYHAFRCIGLSCLLTVITKATGTPLNLELDDDGEEHNINAQNLARSRESMARGHAADVSDNDSSRDSSGHAEGDAFIDRDTESAAANAKRTIDDADDEAINAGQVQTDVAEEAVGLTAEGGGD